MAKKYDKLNIKDNISFFKIRYFLKPLWTLEEAAHLVCGKDPNENCEISENSPLTVSRIYIVLKNKLDGGKLKNHSKDPDKVGLNIGSVINALQKTDNNGNLTDRGELYEINSDILSLYKVTCRGLNNYPKIKQTIDNIIYKELGRIVFDSNPKAYTKEQVADFIIPFAKWFEDTPFPIAKKQTTQLVNDAIRNLDCAPTKLGEDQKIEISIKPEEVRKQIFFN